MSYIKLDRYDVSNLLKPIDELLRLREESKSIYEEEYYDQLLNIRLRIKNEADDERWVF